MRLGIFGGSFDPIHFGHLILAEQCREQAKLDQVLFIPNASSPHKRDGALGTDRQRTEMMDLAISGHPSFLRSNVEIERGGVSYTVDTLEQLKELHADDDLFFLMGGDSLNRFHTWKSPARILELATPLIMARPGQQEIDFNKLASFVGADRLSEIRALAIVCPLIGISSTDLRTRIAAGGSIRYFTPRAVEKYIETQNVYRKKPAKVSDAKI